VSLIILLKINHFQGEAAATKQRTIGLVVTRDIKQIILVNRCGDNNKSGTLKAVDENDARRKKKKQ
jgi:hypothetical protein